MAAEDRDRSRESRVERVGGELRPDARPPDHPVRVADRDEDAEQHHAPRGGRGLARRGDEGGRELGPRQGAKQVDAEVDEDPAAHQRDHCSQRTLVCERGAQAEREHHDRHALGDGVPERGEGAGAHPEHRRLADGEHGQRAGRERAGEPDGERDAGDGGQLERGVHARSVGYRAVSRQIAPV